MPVVNNVTRDPAGNAVARAKVRIELVASDTPPATGYTSTGTVINEYDTTAGTDGGWSATLPGNSAITPTGTYYRVSEYAPGSNLAWVSLISVPASGGPYNLTSLLVTSPDPPDSLAITGVQVAAGGTVAGTRPEINVVAGSNVTVAAVDNSAANRIDVTITSTAGGAGPASTVTDETSYGVAKAVGASTGYAREDHTHGSPALTSSAPTATEAIGTAAAVGVAAAPARADHVHPMAAAGAPAASAVGDTQSTGAATTFAASDHRHAREGFGAVTAQTSYGASSANGSAATVSRSDHAHGTPPTPYTVLPFSVPGTVAVAAGTARLYNDSGRTLTIQAVRASAGTAPTGASLVVDINKNGSTIFTTQGNRPTIVASVNTSGKVTNMDVTSLADGDYLTVDVDQIGSTVAGADLTVQIWIA